MNIQSMNLTELQERRSTMCAELENVKSSKHENLTKERAIRSLESEIAEIDARIETEVTKCEDINGLYGAYLIEIGKLMIRGFNCQEANDACIDEGSRDSVIGALASHGFDHEFISRHIEDLWAVCRSLQTPKLSVMTPEKLQNFFDELAK